MTLRSVTLIFTYFVRPKPLRLIRSVKGCEIATNRSNRIVIVKIREHLRRERNGEASGTTPRVLTSSSLLVSISASLWHSDVETGALSATTTCCLRPLDKTRGSVKVHCNDSLHRRSYLPIVYSVGRLG